MADNYIEKKMDDLKSGRLSATAHSSSSPRRRLASYPSSSLRFDGACVVVKDGTEGLGPDIVKEFRSKGASVDILGKDWAKGQKVAQQTGSRFFTVDTADKTAVDEVMEKILTSRGKIDVIIDVSSSAV